VEKGIQGLKFSTWNQSSTSTVNKKYLFSANAVLYAENMDFRIHPGFFWKGYF
jgi:hypothetical protein